MIGVPDIKFKLTCTSHCGAFPGCLGWSTNSYGHISEHLCLFCGGSVQTNPATPSGRKQVPINFGYWQAE